MMDEMENYDGDESVIFQVHHTSLTIIGLTVWCCVMMVSPRNREVKQRC